VPRAEYLQEDLLLEALEGLALLDDLLESSHGPKLARTGPG
jgi:hypothetical protein